MTKIPNFENARWRTAAILKIVLSLCLSRKSSDFNEIWYVDADCASKVGYLTKYKKNSNSKWRTAAILKMVFWLYLNEKFCRIKQNSVLMQVTWPKIIFFRKFKMADRRHFENSFIAISQPEIIRFQRNLVLRCRLCFQGRLLNKILKFCQLKMADGRHIGNRLLAISRRMD